jgi:hypothetical protein
MEYDLRPERCHGLPDRVQLPEIDIVVLDLLIETEYAVI